MNTGFVGFLNPVERIFVSSIFFKRYQTAFDCHYCCGESIYKAELRFDTDFFCHDLSEVVSDFFLSSHTNKQNQSALTHKIWSLGNRCFVAGSFNHNIRSAPVSYVVNFGPDIFAPAVDYIIRTPVRAIVAYTDLIAAGVMRYLRSRKIRIPDDIAVTGFSGTILSEMIYPPLTTVDLPLFEMGETVAELILEKISDPSIDRTITLDAQIQLRESTEG